jgi:N-acyl-D-amino-acid deacylase
LSSAHPRAYGTFTRVIGKFVRDDKMLSLQQAIHQLSNLPAVNLKLERRGELKPGNYADIVLFDPKLVKDHATYEKPQQYATGVSDVLVNGVQVIKNGEHTGATPGRFIKGPGFRKK